MAEKKILHNITHKKKRIFDKITVKKDLDLDISNIANKEDEISDNNDLRELLSLIHNPRTKKRIFDEIPVKKKKRIFDEIPVKKDLIDLDISKITNKNEISDNNDLRELLSLIDNRRIKKGISSKIDEVKHTIKGQTLDKNKFISNQK
jgi:hypothetical protein